MEEQRHRRLGPGQDAGQEVVAGAENGVEDAQDHAPGIEAAAGPRDEKDAGKAEGGAEPADQGNTLAQDRAGGQHQQDRGDVDDRHRLGHRHDAEGEEHGDGGNGEEEASEQDEAGALRVPDGAAVAGPHGDKDERPG